MMDIVFELIRAVVIGIILVYLWRTGQKEEIHKQQGWGYILAGFLLLFLGMLVDIIDKFPSLNRYLVIGDTEYEAFLEKVVGSLFGFILLAIGFWKWMPTVIALRTTQRQLKEHQDELETRVVERAAEIGRLSRVVEESPISVIITDPNGNIEYVNLFFTKTTGYSAAEVIGRNPHILSSGHTSLEEYQGLWRAITSGQVWQGIFHNKRKDGSLYWESATIAPLTDQNGKICNFVALKENITERKQAEEKRLEAEKRFRSYFELGLIGMAVTSLEKGWIHVNDRLCEILGYPREELTKLTWTEITYSDDLEADVAQFNCVLAGEIDGYSMDKRFIRKDGEVIHASISAKCVRKEDGNIDYFVALVQDITERKQAEEALRRTRDELETRVQERTTELVKINRELASEVAERRRAEHELQELNETLEQRVAQRAAEAKRRADEMEQFVYVASHDLKAPLRGVANLAAWLQEGLAGKLNDETAEQLVLLQDRVGRMHILIEGLLEYSRVGRTQETKETVDTGALLDEAIDSLSLPTDVVVDIAPDMPTLHTDRLLLSQVFTNLVDNAVKHHEGSQAHVWVAVCDAGRFYEFSVTDDGPGIAPQYHQKVFMMFQTLAIRDMGADSGIGLALVKKIVEEHGGSITLDSEVGKGTIFRFTWPK